MGYVQMFHDHTAFWAELAPCDHVLQLYDSDETLLAHLESFAAEGLCRGEGVIIIATAEHLTALEARLRRVASARGFSLDDAAREDAYIALEAGHVLSRFIVGDWPDQALFEMEVRALLDRARGGAGGGGRKTRKVRAFGEMVALLWARGHTGATVCLEHLWESICAKEKFSVFCAYPRIGLTQDPALSIRDTCEAIGEICRAHTRTLAG
jgi:hypothetical protein